MSRAATKYVNWKITVDGVEVPWISFSVQVGVDSSGMGMLAMEPDPILKNIRPTSLVHIWMYDDFETNPDIYERYKLWWEGEISGISYVKTAQARQVILSLSGLMSVLESAKIYALGLGQITSSHIITGSTLIEGAAIPQNVVKKALIPREFQKEETKSDGSVPQDTGSLAEMVNFGERMLNIIAYLSSFNAVSRLNIVRRDLLGKITTVKDAALGRMLPRVLIQPFFDQILSGISGGASVLDLVKSVSSAVFYNFVSTTGPVKRDPIATDSRRYFNLEEGGTSSDWTSSKNVYSIPAFNFRNDYFFAPRLYYALPPPCNFIFPEFIQGMNVTRSFISEPTRLVLTSRLGATVSVVAPDQILRYVSGKPTPESFWCNTIEGIERKGTLKSPYSTKTGLNLFAAASDIEIERGINAIQVDPDFELFAAVSNLLDLRTEDSAGRLSRILADLKDLPSGAAKIEERFVDKERAFVYVLKALADYHYKLARFARNVQVQMDGHRWLVPGLPCAIFDTDQSYVGLINSHAFSVDAEGNEVSSVALDYVRPFPQINAAYVEKLDEEEAALADIEKECTAFENSVNNAKKRANDQYEAIMKGLEAIKKDLDKAAEQIGVLKVDQNYLNKSASYLVETMIRSEHGLKREWNAFNTTAQTIQAQVAADPTYGIDAKALDAAMTNLYRITVKAGGEPYPANFYETMLASLSAMNQAITRYYEESLVRGQKAAAQSDSRPITVYGTGDAANKLSAAIQKYKPDENIYPEDFFAPPVFANYDLIDLAKATKFYKELVGSVSLGQVDKPEMKNPTVFSLKREAYHRFLDFADTVDKIFPATGSVAAPNTEWGRRASQSEEFQSVRRWEEKTYLRRTGLLSLAEFARINGLKITTERSVEPSIVEFIVLKPSKDDWDSIFSKIVDEFVLRAREVTIRDESGNVVNDETINSDVEIQRLKRSVRDPMLTAQARQALIIDYSRQHFGSRGFDGR